MSLVPRQLGGAGRTGRDPHHRGWLTPAQATGVNTAPRGTKPLRRPAS